MRSSKFLRTLALACATIALGMAISAQAQTLNYFANFDGKNGWEPYGSVTQATDGNFYGTTGGGINGVYGNDNVFRMTPSGEISSIYNFGSQPNCTNGTLPFTAPILGSDGNLYGVTYAGGTVCGGNGVVYKMTLNGAITILHTFCSSKSCADGGEPSGMILASDGNFYGATGFGGTASYGTIFKISPTGKYQVLYSFCSQANCTDGEGADFPPIQGRDGNFYGTTGAGGTLGAGVFYELTASGVYKVLHNFCGYFNCPVGEYSYAYTITQGANGNFYGTTDAGVFELTSTGQYTALAKFAGEPSTMGWPGTPLILASDGNFYGTFIGGSSGSWAPYATGGIYEITPQGELKALYGFCRGCDSTGSTTQGFTPLDQVFQGTDGNFYGTTAYGGIGGGKGGAGDWGFGTVFQFSNGLSPLVETVPVAGKAGQSVIILGYGLSGTTGVTFNGIAAEFTVESDTYIRATVPAGASSGMVSVDTPAGTLKSNPQFVVTK
jgi:uncharacterized repeat protein (TIGR03803 family)